jgi:hypothetical protein
MKVILFLNLILFFFSCTTLEDNLNNCSYTLKSYIDSNQGAKYARYIYDDTITIIDERINGKIGSVYSFNKKGNLIDYRFYDKINSFTYNEQYINGNLYKKGNSIVKYYVKTDIIGYPYLNIDYFLLNKKIENVKLEINGKIQQIHVDKSENYTNMYNSAIKFPKKYLTDKIKPMVVLKCDIIYCDGSKELVIDTINNGR